jgi:DNA primase
MRFEQTFIQEIVALTDITSVIQKFIVLKKSGNNYSACCPFHDEKTPSFSVNQTKQFYYCFGCKASGNVISFLMEYNKQSFSEAVIDLAQAANIKLPNVDVHQVDIAKINSLAANFYSKSLKASDKTINYLKKRNITGISAKNFNLGFGTQEWDSLYQFLKNKYKEDDLLASGLISKGKNAIYDKFQKRLIFPIKNHQGKVVAFGGRSLSDEHMPKYLNSPETNIFKKSQVLYGLYECIQKDQLEEIIIVEGYLDVIKLHQHEITNAVAALGTSFSTSHIALLNRYTKKIIFCFDGDKAGLEAAKKALQLTSSFVSKEIQINFIILKNNHDPDSYIDAYKKEGFLELMRKSLSFDKFFFYLLDLKYDTKIPMQKTAFMKEAKEKIQELNDETLKEVMLDELKQKTGINVNTIEEKKYLDYNNPSKHHIIKILTSILIKNSDYYEKLLNKEIINSFNYPPLQSLISIIQKNPEISTGEIISFDEKLSEEILQEQDENFQKFESLIKICYKQKIKKEIKNTLKQFKDKKMSSDEHENLLKLIKKSKEL